MHEKFSVMKDVKFYLGTNKQAMSDTLITSVELVSNTFLDLT